MYSASPERLIPEFHFRNQGLSALYSLRVQKIALAASDWIGLFSVDLVGSN